MKEIVLEYKLKVIYERMMTDEECQKSQELNHVDSNGIVFCRGLPTFHVKKKKNEAPSHSNLWNCLLSIVCLCNTYSVTPTIHSVLASFGVEINYPNTLLLQ